MNLVNNQLSREKLQMIIFKTLIGAIVFMSAIFLIRDEGFFFGVH
tara:strand:+ start:762 stop:896 length:135 start_codon:yes stop_codon:yes gene_type:complete